MMLQGRFPSAIFDWKKGDLRVQAGLEDLIRQECPELILESQRSCFGHSVYVEIAEPEWLGAKVFGYIHSIESQQGDTITMETVDADPATQTFIVNALIGCLGMRSTAD